jgi:hypothetical protein
MPFQLLSGYQRYQCGINFKCFGDHFLPKIINRWLDHIDPWWQRQEYVLNVENLVNICKADRPNRVFHVVVVKTSNTVLRNSAFTSVTFLYNSADSSRVNYSNLWVDLLLSGTHRSFRSISYHFAFCSGVCFCVSFYGAAVTRTVQSRMLWILMMMMMMMNWKGFGRKTSCPNRDAVPIFASKPE